MSLAWTGEIAKALDEERLRVVARNTERMKARVRQILYLVKHGIPYEIADKLDVVELAAHVEIIKEMEP